MVTPINSNRTSEEQAPQRPAPKPEAPERTPKSGAVSSDQVTLKNSSDVDRDGQK